MVVDPGGKPGRPFFIAIAAERRNYSISGISAGLCEIS